MRVAEPGVRTRTAAETAAGTAIVRAPFYFGPGQRIFGWRHAPAGGTVLGSVVICAPLGHEYFSTHRSLRHLADRLATAGFAALRFDYPGTGDSAESLDDGAAGFTAACIASVGHAIEAMQRAAGAAPVNLIGLRMGALFAAEAAAACPVGGLVLWAPCVSGRTFLRELKALAAGAFGAPAPDASGSFDAGGFHVTGALARELAALHLPAQQPAARRVLVVDRDDLPDSRAGEAWTAGGLELERVRLPGFPEMVVAPHNTTVPRDAIDCIRGWLVSVVGIGTADTASDAPGCPDSGELTGDAFRERVLRFGPVACGFGIGCDPLTPVAGAPRVLLANAGSVHHVGPNRLYVDVARALARRGIPSLRFDLVGLGDSVSDDQARENDPYPPDATTMIAWALDAWMAASPGGPAVLAGLCSGAHAAFHATVALADRPIAGCVVINPLTFAYRRGMSLDTASEPRAIRWQRYRRSIGSVQGWLKVFRREIPVRTIVGDVAARLAAVPRRALIGAADRLRRGAAPAPGLTGELQRLVDQGRTMTLVCSEFDPGHDLLMSGAGPLARRLKKSGHLRVLFVTRANHTFDFAPGRAELVARLTEEIASRWSA